MCLDADRFRGLTHEVEYASFTIFRKEDCGWRHVRHNGTGLEVVSFSVYHIQAEDGLLTLGMFTIFSYLMSFVMKFIG